MSSAKTCCGCIELRTGCLIIGYLSLISNITNAIMDWTIIHAINEYKDYYGGLTHSEKILLTAFVSSMVIFVLNIFFCIIFVAGLHGNKPGCVKTYIVYSIIMFLFEYTARFYKTVNASEDLLNKNNWLVNVIICILLDIYFLSVIYSQYHEMVNPTTHHAVYCTPVVNSPAIYNVAINNPTSYNPAINSYPGNGPAMPYPTGNGPSMHNPAGNSYPGNGPSMHNPAGNSYPGNGPSMHNPAGNSYPGNGPSMHNPTINSNSIYPNMNSSALYPPTNSPPPYSSVVNAPATNYPVKY